ncbi:rho-N domain-containing protein 1 chloroplastic [Prunus yedoensis var. nudiflora]|uniref:Rho-N domain-containing protein 1 chloroplastic n=1 Tax=Prunus yedoensis var. nudiflora TaxID=2094558 RepID=A0A314UIN5_PRUYE|nr:rho-N domain-containing protein 1 chloroplastic [Prunus yedoensis var. nudiflora]
MLQGVHIIGYGPSDGKCLPCSGISGRVAPAYPSSSRFNHRFKASSSGRNRNPDFPRQNRHGYSRGRNRKNDDRDGFENLEESDMLSSKNGPLVSLSSGTKFGATAAPGPREKEIVELFRKVQAQLRERSAVKEEKKADALQGQGKENETVDSLLKLLRKHSVEQAKRTNSSGSNKDFTLDQPEKNARYSERKSTTSFDSNNSLKDEVEEPNASFSRPASNFQRKSPIPRLTYQPIYSEDDHIGNSVPHLLEEETSGPDETLNFDDENGEKQQLIEHKNLSALKLPELRALAKSQGVKGFSKMKKGELVELLSGSSV